MQGTGVRVDLRFSQNLVRFPGDPPADAAAPPPAPEQPAAVAPPAAAAEESPPAAQGLASRMSWRAWALLSLIVFAVGSAVIWVLGDPQRSAPPTVVVARPYPTVSPLSPAPAAAEAKPSAPPVRRVRAKKPKPGTTKQECIRVLLDPSQDVCEQVPQ
jgi:hypothetical protein